MRSSPGLHHTHAPSQPLSAEGASTAPAPSLLPPPCSPGAGAAGGRSTLPAARGGGHGRPPSGTAVPLPAELMAAGSLPPPALPVTRFLQRTGTGRSERPRSRPRQRSRAAVPGACRAPGPPPRGRREGGRDTAEPRRRGVPAPRTPLLPALRRAAAPTCPPSTSSSWKRLCRTARR